jgi:cation diffusion facilitator family transporter
VKTAEKSLMKDPLRLRIVAISSSFLIGVALLGLKFYAYRLTHSSAILSDALESIINVVASAFALGSVLLSAKPPDKSHPYGHGKIEYFSAGFEGALIILAALGIFYAAWPRILHPREIPQLQEGLWILLGISIVCAFLGLALVRVGRQTHSLTIIADGKHVLTDAYTTGGVLVALFLVHLTGWYWLDGAIALLVGLNILISGGRLVRQSFEGLMDAADPELLKQVSDVLIRHRRKIWIDIHELRAWRSGNLIHLDLHLILPKDLSLEDAHREAKNLEKAIVARFEGKASVLVHMDPCVEPDCPVCRRHSCEFRAHDQATELPAPWDSDTLTLGGETRGPFQKPR